MKNMKIYLRGGLMLLSFSLICSSSMAQGGEKQTGKQVTENQIKTREGNKSSAMKRGATVTPAAGSTSRNCTPKQNLTPYAITREVFNSLPANRQQFVLNNLHQYSIVD
jgi:hypothetical protein